MMDQQVDLKKIPSSAVGFDKPYCFKHNQDFRVEKVTRSYDFDRCRLTVTRYCICKKCQADGEKNFRKLVNSKDFDL